MEAPEKIYVHVKGDKVTNTWNSTWIGVHDVEYTRNDAFIDKACEWLKRHVEDEKYKTPDEESYRHGLPCDYFETDMFIDDFRKAMEEQQ